MFFESSDVWSDITDEELLEIRKLVMLFLISTVIQRVTHALLEVLVRRGGIYTFIFELSEP